MKNYKVQAVEGKKGLYVLEPTHQSEPQVAPTIKELVERLSKVSPKNSPVFSIKNHID